MKPPDTSLPTTLCFPGYIDLNDSGLSVQSVQAKPIFRVGRGHKQIVTIRFQVRRFVCRSAKKLRGELADHQSPDLAVAKR